VLASAPLSQRKPETARATLAERSRSQEKLIWQRHYQIFNGNL
jgi:hypothetical protein